MYQQQQYQQVQDTNPPCRQLMVQPPQFSQQWQAPFPQQIIGVPQNINADLCHIANAVGNTIGQWAQTNFAYTYYFNVVAYQNFNNQNFMDLVEFAARYFLLLMQERAAGSVQEALSTASQEAVRILASVTVLKNPQLQQHLSPDIWNGCINIAGKLQSVVAQFNRGQQQQQSTGYGGGQPAGGGYVTNTGGGYGRPVGVVVEPFQPVQVPNTYQQGNGGPVYVEPGRNHRSVVAPVKAADSEEATYFAIPGMTTQPVPQKAAPPEPVRASTVTHISKDQGVVVTDLSYRVMGIEKPVDTNWTPFADQMYKPAYHYPTQRLVVEYTKIGNTQTFRNVAYIEPLENKEMNRADHVITTAQALYRGMAQTEAPRTTLVSQDLDLTARAMEAVASREDDETTESFRKLNLMESDVAYTGEDSLISFVTTARLRRLQVQKEEKRNAFMINGSIVTNFVVDQDLSMPLFQVLATLKTFDEVVDALKAFTERNPTEAASALVWRIDRYLRRELLHVIRKRMGVVPFSFDSFIDDQFDVFKVLEADWGPVYRKALAKYQGDFIAALFSAANVRFDDDGAPLVASEPKSTVTLLDIDYDEFGVRINDEASHEVFPSNFPGLYEFITAVVTNHPEALHHYIVTEDDFVYEVHRSIVGDKMFLISNGPSLA